MPCIGAKSHSGAGHFALMAVSIFPLLPGFFFGYCCEEAGLVVAGTAVCATKNPAHTC